MQFVEGTEDKFLSHVKANGKQGDAASCIEAMHAFCWKQAWMMNVGDEKGPILASEVA